MCHPAQQSPPLNIRVISSRAPSDLRAQQCPVPEDWGLSLGVYTRLFQLPDDLGAIDAAGIVKVKHIRRRVDLTVTNSLTPS